MRSSRPKVLHPVGGRAMLAHVLEAARTLAPARTVVVTGAGGAEVAAAARAAEPGAAVVEQAERLGTAHAVMQALPALEDFAGDVVVLYGDTPLLTAETLGALAAAPGALSVLGFEAADPAGYGRLVLDADGALAAIVEHKDASEAERAIRLCNSGVMRIDAARLPGWLARVGAENAKGEYYLTDLVALARADGAATSVVRCDEAETLGVNARAELAAAEAAFQARARARVMAEGVTLIAPETVFLSADARIGRDVTIHPHVVIGPGVEIADGAEVRAFSHLEGARVGPGAAIGPYARLRPGAVIGEGAHVGNFVEVKNAELGAGAKANHLTYLGDAEVGPGANIGAGTITCNYDGVSKHRTEIGAGAFVGSNTALVAPVRIGAGATVGAGSTVTEDVPDDALAVARGRQETRPGAARRLRARLKALRDRARGAA